MRLFKQRVKPAPPATPGIAATGEITLDVEKNGSNIGTVSFVAASSTPVFALASRPASRPVIASAS
jgi:hypothetical protein